MKKTIIFIVLLATAGGGLQAQDTLLLKGPKVNYYSENNWIDTADEYQYFKWFLFQHSWCIAKRFITKDTLEVYGIAAMLVNELFDRTYDYIYPDSSSYLNYHYPNDPTLNRCEESLLLFQYHDSTPSPIMHQLGDSLHVHTVDTPVTYWLEMDLIPDHEIYEFRTIPLFPVYEQYFQTVQSVCDTFYTGFTQSFQDHSATGPVYTHPFTSVVSFRSSSTPGAVRIDSKAVYIQSPGDEEPHWFFNDHISSYFIFPILTPEQPVDTTVTPVDTTVTPIDTVTPEGDTTGVQKADLVSRYVSVLPNPAHESAEVLSSFGLTLIEVYDGQGRLLRSLPAAGLKATLDLHSLPPSTYLLRIHTPAGTTTKKLLVR